MLLFHEHQAGEIAILVCVKNKWKSFEHFSSGNGRSQMVKYDVLALGMEGAGKTFLMRRAAAFSKSKGQRVASDASTIPTIGVELYEISHGKRNKKQVYAREVGGCMLPVWQKYYEDCRLLIYVVDASDMSRLAPAVIELYALLKEPTLEGKRVCLVFNKMDTKDALHRSQLESLFILPELLKVMKGRLTVLETSALTGSGLSELLAWITHVEP